MSILVNPARGRATNPAHSAIGRGSPFTPADVAGYVLDLNPITNKVTLSGSDVTDIQDSATADGSQDATTGTAPAYASSDASFNNHPSVTHASASSEYLTLGDVLDLGNDSLLVVAALNLGSAAGTDQRLFDKRTTGAVGAQAGFVLYAHTDFGSANPDGGTGNEDGFSLLVDDGSAGVWAGGDTRIDDGSTHIVEAWYDASTSTAHTAVDGTSGTASTGTLGSVTNSLSLSVGAYDTGAAQGQFYNGSWARIILYKRSADFTDSERSQVRQHLADLYGVTL